MALFESVSLWRLALRSYMLMIGLEQQSPLTVDQDVGSQILLQHHVCLYVTMIMDYTFGAVSQLQLNVFLIRVAVVMVPLHSNRNLT